MIAAIKSKFTNSLSQIVSAFHVLNPVAAPGILTDTNSALTYLTLLLILVFVGVSAVRNLAGDSAFGKINSTTALS